MTIQSINDWSEKFEISSSLFQPELLMRKTMDFLFEEVRETERAFVAYEFTTDLPYLSAMLDGFGDVAFVAINGIYKSFRLLNACSEDEAKAKTFEVLNRIIKANFNKLHDGRVVKENNKVVKPEGWKAPTYEDLL